MDLRTMTEADLPAAMEMSRAVGWPHTPNDWAVAFNLGHGVVVVEQEHIVGVMLWWPQGPDHATLGLAIVPETHQRRGIGQMLIEEILRQAGDRAVSLCGTVEGLRLYERAGFVTHGTVHQIQGAITADDGESLEPDLVEAPEFASLLQLDSEVDGRVRDDLVSALAVDGDVLGLRNDSALVGWSMCRPFGQGWLIGPVVARSTADAERLVQPWLDRHVGDFVRMDTPADSGLSELLTNRGLALVGEGFAMTRGDAASPGALKRYALASQAFG